jgi:hypothetical protein
MFAASHRNLPCVLLVAEVPILLVTLGLLAWSLHVLGHSISLNSNLPYYSYGFPPAQMYTWTLTRTVTGYSSSSVSSASLETLQPSAYTVIGLDHSKTPHTNPGVTYTIGPYTYGIDPTGTKTRTVTVSGIEEISHRKRDFSNDEVLSQPKVTPAPLVIQPRQESASSSTGPPRLGDLDFWNLSSFRSRSYEQYQSVTVNRGFDGYFQEVGLDYIYKSPYNNSSVVPKIRALTALAALSLVAIIGRLSCTAVFLLLFRKTKEDKVKKERDDNSTVKDDEININDDKLNRKTINYLHWSNFASTFLLYVTYLPFWSLYGSWTHRNSLINKANEEFQSDPDLAANGLNNLLKSMPWTSIPIALIVFWTLAVVTSIATCIYSSTLRKREQRQSSNKDTVM